VYKRDLDSSTPEAQADITAWKDRERELGPRPHVLPTKQHGRWSGVFEVFDTDQSKRGDMQVTIDHRPETLTRAQQTITWDGVLNRQYTVERSRNSANVTYEGPDAWGNAAPDRALFSSIHFAAATSGKIRVASSSSTPTASRSPGNCSRVMS
jgi:hypothetical protein